MEYNSELEEGEACCDKDDGNNMDPDAFLSYIDEKLGNVFGHFRKSFKTSAEELGKKFDEHGSFFTMNGCSSPVRSHAKLQTNYGTQEFKKSKHAEGPSSKKAHRNASFQESGINASSSVQEVDGTRLAAGNAPLQNDSQLSQVATNSKLKDDSLNKSVVSTGQRSLKFRLKVCQDNTIKKNNTLYSGLGLNNTPSPSLGNSPGETGELLTSSDEITDDSPTSILQVMTSISIPGGAIVSPLPDCFLSLLRNENDGSFKNKKVTSFFNGSQDKFVPLSSEPAVVFGTLSENNVRKPMGKNKRSIEKKNADPLIVESENVSFSKQRFECIVPGGKEVQSKDLKMHILDSTGANLSKDVTIDPLKNSRSNNSMSLPRVKLKCISKDESSRKNPSCKWGDVKMEFEKEKPLLTGRKKLKCSESSGQAAASSKEILRADLVATANGTDNDVVGYHISTKKCRLNTSTPEKDDLPHLSERHYAKQPKHYSLNASHRKETVPCDNLKEIISNQKVDDQASNVSLKDVPLTVPPNTGDALASEAATPGVPMDGWVGCDACQTWRLLPYSIMTEQLPDKWVCSMLNWLPQMNRCDISEHDTTEAVRKLFPLPITSQKSVQDVVNGNASTLTAPHFRHVAQTNWSLNSEGVAAQAKKKYGSKQVRKSDGTHGLIQISGTSKDIPKGSVKRRSLNDIAHVPAESNALNKSGFQQDERHKIKGLKKINLKDSYSGERHQGSNLDLQIDSQNVHASLQMASGSMKKPNEFAEFVCDTKERIAGSVKKHAQINQNSSGGALSDKKNISTRKRKLLDLQDCQNESYVKEECREIGIQRKKARFSKHGTQYSGGYFPNRKDRAEFAGSSAWVESVDEAHQLKSKTSKSSFQHSRDALDTWKRDLGSRHVVKTANSSSSKISGFHKTKVNIEEVKGSPVESVSSSPLRTSYQETLASAFGAIVPSDVAANGGVPVTTNSRCSDGEGAHDLISSGLVKKEKRDSDSNTGSHKFSVVEFTGRNAELKVDGKAKALDIGKSNMFPNDAETIKQKVRLRKQNAFGHCEDDGRANIEPHLNPSFLHKMGKEHASQKKDNIKSLAGNKVKALEQPVDEREYPNAEKGNFLEISKSIYNKSEIYNCRRDSLGQKSHGSRMENVREHNKPVTKLVAQCCTNGNASPLQNPIKDYGVAKIHAEAAGSKHKSVSELAVQIKQESHYYFAAEVPSQRVLFKEFPVKASSNKDVLKVTNEPGNVGRKSVAWPQMTDVHLVGPDLSAQKPGPYLFEPCKQLRELADSLKNSGFSFENNEACFKCALEFLREASLSETCTSEGGKHGDISTMQLQAYSMVIKICEKCAQEYEKLKEMAAASLAYKCMEVAYMRVVYCKSSFSSCELSELQAALMPSEGESPSSSASDVDNLNHQAAVGKRTVSNVSGTHVDTRKCPSIIRLLDFTQNVSSAMEASTKSRKAFEAANLSLAEAENKECMTFVRKVIDFSFQDVEGLILLVQQALDAISRPDLGGGH